MKAPRFSLKRFLVSITLVAIGIGILMWVLSPKDSIEVFALGMPMWLVGGVMIGAGVFAPFRLTLWGAVLGFLVQLVIFLLFFLVTFNA
jgi:hypothetical protein